MTGKLKVLDNLVASLRAELPQGYNFNFFVTHTDKLSVRGVWYLQVSQEVRKQVQSEKQIKIRRRKKA